MRARRHAGSGHPAEFAAQSASAHAHTLAPAKAPQPGDWAFGAGVQAITFVSRVDRENLSGTRRNLVPRDSTGTT